jgi:poly-gamma-glutamate synthesis protein (capsule biosynthesis protein)
MIFIGDIALPFDYGSLQSSMPWRQGRPVIANLEGDIVRSPAGLLSRRVVFSTLPVLDYLERIGVRAVTLANNHIFEVRDSCGPTVRALAGRSISSCGAGATLHEARQPCILEEDSAQIAVLAFGWEPIGCRTASHTRRGVNPLTAGNVLGSLQAVKRRYPDASIVLCMHWNYELELYPQPMHRQLAFQAIDAGANAIIGTHSHRVQGVEIYRGAPIAYSLGNWILPQHVFFGGQLSYPEVADLQLAFEWTPGEAEPHVHWVRYESADHSLHPLRSEPLSESKHINRLTPFQGWDHDTYIEFFRAHRAKRKLLPIYRNVNHRTANAWRDRWVWLRDRFINALVRSGAKSSGRRETSAGRGPRAHDRTHRNELDLR